MVPIPRGNWKETVLPKAQALAAELKAAGVRVFLDDSDMATPGWKFSEWEMRGVPLRLEIGPKDIDKGQAVLVSRLGRKKHFVPWSELADTAKKLLGEIQAELLARARRFRDESTRDAATLAELAAIIETQRGFVRTGWCGSADCEGRVKADTSATIRVILEDHEAGRGACAVCAQPARHTVLFARSY
jgi:prolyl-tRNA synthetase